MKDGCFAIGIPPEQGKNEKIFGEQYLPIPAINLAATRLKKVTEILGR
ncbi:MAG: hypothetical protein WCA35_24375 [Kovacikia sp.]